MLGTIALVRFHSQPVFQRAFLYAPVANQRCTAKNPASTLSRN
jgi:hypothetical protein